LFNNVIDSTQWFGGPSSLVRGEQGIGFFRDTTYVDPTDGTTKNWMTRIRGVVFQAYEYKLKQINDGTGKTYMVGEKYLMPEEYSLAPGEKPSSSARPIIPVATNITIEGRALIRELAINRSAE
jgi:hypothetical protein